MLLSNLIPMTVHFSKVWKIPGGNTVGFSKVWNSQHYSGFRILGH